MDTNVVRLEEKAKQLRRHIVRMIGVGQKGHLGGSCSIAEVVAVLYLHRLKIDPTIDASAGEPSCSRRPSADAVRRIPRGGWPEGCRQPDGPAFCRAIPSSDGRLRP